MLGVTLDMRHCPVMSCYVPECFTKASLELRKASTATPLLLPVFVTVKPHSELWLEPLRKSDLKSQQANYLASKASKAVGKVKRRKTSPQLIFAKLCISHSNNPDG